MLNKNLKSILAISLVVVVLFCWEYFNNKKHTHEITEKLKNENCVTTIEGFTLGITKKEFDKKHIGLLDSLEHSIQTGYIDKRETIQNFHGFNVSQIQFVFYENMFEGLLTRTSLFTGIGFNLKNVTVDDISRLTAIICNSEWESKEYLNDDGSLKYSSQWNEINRCIGVNITYYTSNNTAHIFFAINDYEIEKITS